MSLFKEDATPLLLENGTEIRLESDKDPSALAGALVMWGLLCAMAVDLMAALLR